MTLSEYLQSDNPTFPVEVVGNDKMPQILKEACTKGIVFQPVGRTYEVKWENGDKDVFFNDGGMAKTYIDVVVQS